MRRQHLTQREKAQSLLEYILLIGIVSMALFTMYHAAKRGIQSVIKVTADQVGIQNEADQRILPLQGYLVCSYVATNSDTQKTRADKPSEVGHIYDDNIRTFSNSLVNLGFTNRAGSDD